MHSAVQGSTRPLKASYYAAGLGYDIVVLHMDSPLTSGLRAWVRMWGHVKPWYMETHTQFQMKCIIVVFALGGP